MRRKPLNRIKNWRLGATDDQLLTDFSLVQTGPGVGLQVGVDVLALMWAADVHTLSVAQEPVVCEGAVGSGRPTPVELYSSAVHHHVPRYGPDA